MMYKVLMPLWWTDGLEVIGFTDNVLTYACELRPSVFVEVPDYEYSGYFHQKDLQYLTETEVK